MVHERPKTWAYPVLVLLAIAPFLPALHGAFVVDDQLGAAKPVRQSLWSSVGDALFLWGFQGSSVEASGPPLYRPVGRVLFELSRRLMGVDPSAWHAQSLALHALNTLLVFALLGALLPKLPPTQRLLSAAVFAVHPALSEAVCWISAASELMATSLALSTAWLYLRWRERWSWHRGVLLALLFVAAITTKEAALALLPLLFLYEWLCHRRLPIGVGVTASLLTAGFLLLRQRVVSGSATSGVMGAHPARVGEMLLAHLGQLMLPGSLPFSIAPPEITLVGPGRVMVVLGVAVALGWWAWSSRRGEARVALFGSAWLLVALWPAAAIALVGDGFIAARHVYLGTVGLCIGIAAVLRALPERHQHLASLSLAVALLPMALLSWNAAGSWRTNLDVYQRMTLVSPSHAGVWLGLGLEQKAQGDMDGSMISLERAYALGKAPDFRADTLYALGQALCERGQVQRCERLLQERVRLTPTSSLAWVGLGNALWMAGQLREAADAYSRGLELDPSNYQAAMNLSNIQSALGLWREAAASRARAAQIAPKPGEAP